MGKERERLQMVRLGQIIAVCFPPDDKGWRDRKREEKNDRTTERKKEGMKESSELPRRTDCRQGEKKSVC